MADKKITIKQYTGTGTNYDTLYPATTATQISYSNSNVQAVVDELYTSVKDGKTQIATAISNKGQSTLSSDTFATMTANVRNIQTFKPEQDKTAYTNGWVYPDSGKVLSSVSVDIPVYQGEIIVPPVYGVEWAGTSSTVWTRTDAAANFSNPVPYVNGMSASQCSSPFDNILPWSGMVRSTDSKLGEIVSIPKFYFKWTGGGASPLKLQISSRRFEGSMVSPAHMDRGDGKGERDVVYVGRYHCAISTYKSTTGVQPIANITRSTARSAIHNLDTTCAWQIDYATRLTIQMLYLVEFADWDSQKVIGQGCGDNSSTGNMGYTDTMPYHTGTTQTSRSTYGLGTQYRYIEGLWDNVLDWLDGCYYSSSGMNIILKPSSFSDTTGGVSIGTPDSDGIPRQMSISSTTNYKWCMYPTASGVGDTYVSDYWGFFASSPCLYVGGNCYQDGEFGLFCTSGVKASDAAYDIGARLIKLP